MFIWYTNKNNEKVCNTINSYSMARHLKKCYKIYGYKKIKLYSENGIRIPLF